MKLRFKILLMCLGGTLLVLVLQAVLYYNDNNEIVSTYRKAVTPKHNYPLDVFPDETYNVAN